VVAALLLEFGIRVFRGGTNPFAKRSENASLSQKQTARPIEILQRLLELEKPFTNIKKTVKAIRDAWSLYQS
jgi:hypothetical protein